MKSIITTLSLLILMGISSVAQPPEYGDLVVLFADGKYDKLIKKCQKYMDKSDTKSDAIPYIYMANAYFEISKDQTWMQKDPTYKRAYGNSLRYAAQFRKKVDRMKEAGERKRLIKEYRPFLLELKAAVMEDVDLYMHGEKPSYSKAAAELKRVVTFAPDDAGAWLLKAVCTYKSGNKSGAKMDFEQANTLLDSLNFAEDVMDLGPGESLSDIENWEKEVQNNPEARMLMNGLIECARMYIESRKSDMAEDYITKGFQWFEKHPVYKEAYDEIVN